MIWLEQLTGPPAQGEVYRLVEQLKKGPWEERKAALAKLIISGAEEELTGCLGSEDPLTNELATAGLWECWLNEEGAAGREAIDFGIDLMEQGLFQPAEQVFRELGREYPAWAEPVNKRALILYARGKHQQSFQLCQWVVEVKPHHFGAWHGLALAAVELRYWREALEAAEEGLRLQPRFNDNREIIRLAKSKLRR